MKAAAFDYARPRDLGEALRLLAEGSGAAKLLAGGQSLGPMLNLRLARPGLLVDVSRLAELREIKNTGSAWRIGGAVTHAEIEDATLPGGEALSLVAAGIAYRAVRTRGTIGGSLAHADPAADWPLALAAVDARIEVRGPNGARRVAAAEFITGAFASILRDGEIVTAVDVAKRPEARWGYFKFCRRTGEFPDASAAAVFDPMRGTARIFVGALAGAPQPLAAYSATIARAGAQACTIEAADGALKALTPLADTPERRMHAAVLRHALAQVWQR